MSKFGAGLVSIIIYGGIGAFFGGTGLIIGIILGIISGVKFEPEFGILGSLLLNEKDRKELHEKDKKKAEDESSTNNEKSTSPRSHKSSSSNKPDSKIIRCPSCKRKIRVQLPLQGSKGKCTACSSSFSIKIDERGNIKIDKATTENTSGSSQGSTTISDYFKILDIESIATPDEVRAAYKRKIREYHPDRVSGLGEKLKKMANEESKAINAAYSALKSKGLAS